MESDHVNALEAIHRDETPRSWLSPTVAWDDERRTFFRRKQFFDRTVGCVMLAVASPAILLLWLLVKATSRGPGFYRQSRVGLDGHCFEMFKLRSMRMDAEASSQPIWCGKGDTRMTWLGRILRALHLDEIPQLINVARGDMSLVGPRPERPVICRELRKCIKGYSQRVLVKPGVTGLSQINLPPDTNLADVMRKQIIDLKYIDETNTWLEFRILAATGLRMFGVKGEVLMSLMRLCRLSELEPYDLGCSDKWRLPKRIVRRLVPRSDRKARRKVAPAYVRAGKVDQKSGEPVAR